MKLLPIEFDAEISWKPSMAQPHIVKRSLIIRFYAVLGGEKDAAYLVCRIVEIRTKDNGVADFEAPRLVKEEHIEVKIDDVYRVAALSNGEISGHYSIKMVEQMYYQYVLMPAIEHKGNAFLDIFFPDEIRWYREVESKYTRDRIQLGS